MWQRRACICKNIRYPPPKSSSSGGGLCRFAPMVYVISIFNVFCSIACGSVVHAYARIYGLSEQRGKDCRQLVVLQKETLVAEL